MGDTHSEILDRRDRIENIDPEGMTAWVEALPDQWRKAEDIARAVDLEGLPRPERIVVLGMGGSAIGGDLARSLLERDARVPITVNRDYTLPGFVNEQTLVIASSYSGNTEETLAACKEAGERGAPVAVITSGGQLMEMAKARNWPAIPIPGGLQPRAAIGYSFVPLLVMLERIGVAPSMAQALEETASVLDKIKNRLGVDVPLQQNPAKQLAVSLIGKLPLVYGSQGWKGMAAYRWKCQLNENSKSPAAWNVFPELNHNETVGWETPHDVLQRTWVIMLRDEKDDPRIATRVDVTKEIVSSKAAGVTEWWAEGDSQLARLFSLIYPGDFVSLYLALASGIDPTPVRMIDYLKDRLSGSRS